MTKVPFISVLGIALLVATTPAVAQIKETNPPPENGQPLFKAVTVLDNGAFGPWGGRIISEGWTNATRFTTAGPFTFNVVRYWGGQDMTGIFSGNVSWWLYYDDASGAKPGATLSSGTSALTQSFLGNTTGSWDEYVDEFNIGSLNLNAGAYWLALNVADPYGVYWQAGLSTGATYQVHTQGFINMTNESSAFQLIQTAPTSTHVTPEPMTMTLVATGLLGLAGAARKRRRM